MNKRLTTAGLKSSKSKKTESAYLSACVNKSFSLFFLAFPFCYHKEATRRESWQRKADNLEKIRSISRWTRKSRYENRECYPFFSPLFFGKSCRILICDLTNYSRISAFSKSTFASPRNFSKVRMRKLLPSSLRRSRLSSLLSTKSLPSSMPSSAFPTLIFRYHIFSPDFQ